MPCGVFQLNTNNSDVMNPLDTWWEFWLGDKVVTSPLESYDKQENWAQTYLAIEQYIYLHKLLLFQLKWIKSPGPVD